MAHRLTIKASTKSAIMVNRRAISDKKLVYVICTAKPVKYKQGRSRIIYIGTTGKGIHRVASSMAHKAIDFLVQRGVKQLDVFQVVCPPRPGIKAWLKLERDLLLAFKWVYGEVPKANKSGKNFTPTMHSGLFQWSRLVKVLTTYQ